MNRLLNDEIYIGEASIFNYKLFDTGWGFPAALPADKEEIYGEVYAVSEEKLREIDLIEGAYDRVTSRVYLKDIEQALWADLYVWRGGLEGLRPIEGGVWK